MLFTYIIGTIALILKPGPDSMFTLAAFGFVRAPTFPAKFPSFMRLRLTCAH